MVVPCRIAIIIIIWSSSIFAQSPRWAVSVGGVIGSGGRHLDENYPRSLEFMPCVSGEVGLAVRIIQRAKVTMNLEYRRGSFATRFKTHFSREDYPYVRTEIYTSTYFVQHPYHVLGVNYDLLKIGRLNVNLFSGFRFVPRSSASTGVRGYDTNNTRIIMFQSTQGSDNAEIAGELRLKADLALFHHWRFGISFVGISKQSIAGDYTFYPNIPGYAISGRYRLAQLFGIVEVTYAFGYSNAAK